MKTAIRRRILIRLFPIFLLTAMPGVFQMQGRSKYWEQKVSLFDKLPVQSEDIVFLGNSLTDGGEWSELFGMENIKNRGITADVISGVQERLHQVTDGKPAKIFLLIGINDVSHNLGAEKISIEYKKLIERIRRETPESKLYIQSVMPINNDFGLYKNLRGRENVIPELNRLIQHIAQENGATYIDLWPALADPKTGKLKRMYTNDGLHLTGKGYKAWAEILFPFVVQP